MTCGSCEGLIKEKLKGAVQKQSGLGYNMHCFQWVCFLLTIPAHIDPYILFILAQFIYLSVVFLEINYPIIILISINRTFQKYPVKFSDTVSITILYNTNCNFLKGSDMSLWRRNILDWFFTGWEELIKEQNGGETFSIVYCWFIKF